MELPSQDQIAALRSLKRLEPINRDVVLRPSGLKAKLIQAYEAINGAPECALVKLESGSQFTVALTHMDFA